MDALEWGDGDLCHVPMVRDVVDGRVEGALDAQDVHDQLTVMDVLDEGNDDQFHVLVARGVLDVHENDSLDAHESHDQSTARDVLESRDDDLMTMFPMVWGVEDRVKGPMDAQDVKDQSTAMDVLARREHLIHVPRRVLLAKGALEYHGHGDVDDGGHGENVHYHEPLKVWMEMYGWHL